MLLFFREVLLSLYPNDRCQAQRLRGRATLALFIGYAWRWKSGA
jgi:hypothetical protein